MVNSVDHVRKGVTQMPGEQHRVRDQTLVCSCRQDRIAVYQNQLALVSRQCRRMLWSPGAQSLACIVSRLLRLYSCSRIASVPPSRSYP